MENNAPHPNRTINAQINRFRILRLSSTSASSASNSEIADRLPVLTMRQPAQDIDVGRLADLTDAAVAQNKLARAGMQAAEGCIISSGDDVGGRVAIELIPNRGIVLVDSRIAPKVVGVA